eukprot:COSAG02_NODE_5839_length_3997_cov_5.153412_4_plen_90_part_00
MNAHRSIVELATNALIPNSVPLPWKEPVSFLLAVQFAPGSFQLQPEPTYGHFTLGNLQHTQNPVNPSSVQCELVLAKRLFESKTNGFRH